MRSNAAIAPRWFADKMFRHTSELQEVEASAVRKSALTRVDQRLLHPEIVFLKLFTADFIVQNVYGGDARTWAILDEFYDRVYAVNPMRIDVVEMMPRFVLYTDAARGLRGTGGRSRDIGEEFANFCDDFAPYENRPRLVRLGAAIHKATTKFVYRLAETYIVREG